MRVVRVRAGPLRAINCGLGRSDDQIAVESDMEQHERQAEEARRAWDRGALARPHVQADKARRVEAMFDAIAPTYERVNTVVSLGRDAAWRRRAVAAADVRATDVVLDVACGTGDMIRAFAAGRTPPRRIIGVDFSAGMLACGDYSSRQRALDTPPGAQPRSRYPAGPPWADAACQGRVDVPACPERSAARVGVHLIRADAQRLPLADGSVDVVSCAFGIRNFQNLESGLDQMHRVLRPGGRVVILEFALPRLGLLRWPYRVYTERVLPRLGRWISRDRSGAYEYLPRSVATFAQTRALVRKLETAGFGEVTTRTMNFGGVILYRAVRPA